MEPPPSQAPRPGGAATPSPPARPLHSGLGWAGSRWAAVWAARLGGAGWEKNRPLYAPDLSRRARSIMTVGARLRSRAASSALRAPGPGRGRTEGDEEGSRYPGASGERGGGGGERGKARRPESWGAGGRVHLAVLPERYEPLEEQVLLKKAQEEVPKKLKKYGKVGNNRHQCPGWGIRRLPES